MVVYDLQAYSSLPQGNCERMMQPQNVNPNGQACTAANVLRSQLRMPVLPAVAKEAPGGQAAHFSSVAMLVCDLQAHYLLPQGNSAQIMQQHNVDTNVQVCTDAYVLPSQLKMCLQRHLLNLTGDMIYRELHRKLHKQFKARTLLISTRSRTLAQ